MQCQLTNKSLVELFMGRQLRTTFDRLHPQYSPSRPLDVKGANQSFGIGDAVYAWNYIGHPLWLPGMIVGVTGPCLYKIEVDQGRVWQ